MSSWNHSIHFCSWVGITCHRATQRVLILDLEDKQLVGSIPPSIGNLTRLIEISLGINEFHGEIPQELGRLRTLKSLNLSFNSLGGKIPTNMSHCTQLRVFDLLSNKIIGSIPRQISSWLSLTVLQLGKNNLSGTIPGWIGNFSSLRSLRLAGNNFQGSIPNELGHITTLKIFFVGDNNLSGSFGSVYRGVIPNDGTVVAVKVLNLQQQGASKSFNDECKALRSVMHRNLVKIITACSSVDNHGRDFKSLVFEFMPNGSLDSWLHPRDKEQSPSKRLNFMQRLNIAIDVASALDYLHNHCETSIVHCDLKPSNVLLDEDMVAHVGDFGLARFLLEASNDHSLSQIMSSQLKGSVGYIPPEYGMGGQVSILGDVYSFGILLLEMFTGKTPTDDMFIEGLSIYKFVAMALPDHVMDVVDPSLLLDLEADGSVNDDRYEKTKLPRRNNHGVVKAKKVEECLFVVMQIGLSCCAISPRERMLLNTVVEKMSTIRDSYLKTQEG